MRAHIIQNTSMFRGREPFGFRSHPMLTNSNHSRPLQKNKSVPDLMFSAALGQLARRNAVDQSSGSAVRTVPRAEPYTLCDISRSWCSIPELMNDFR